MAPAACFEADIVERRYVDVALIVERQRRQGIGYARVHHCIGGRHAHHAVVQLILRPLDTVIVQETQGPTTGMRRLISGIRQHILEASAVSYILRQVQANIALPGNKKPRQWTGHSFRVGAAVDLFESGYTIEKVMRNGDWKSVQAGLRYVMAE